ncbi:MAG: 1-deoxy-D-xylulose-5-phosphate synthase, partial [Clostridia bacterium]|nr:1-deoxy-D-xylulose-5-phosphate synthase [Clostridia bacterium]
MDSILQKVNTPSDLKDLSYSDLERLAAEIRELMIDTVSKNGGHLASNLGIVELTIAIHKVFKSPSDQIIFDVGHQAYVHKILTGRKDDFYKLRTENGISGFTRPDESEHDIFFSGHSSTSVSSAFGLAMANKLKNSKNHVVAVCGDGAFTGGLVFEGLNNAGRNKSKLIVILNDNEMSISKNVGSFAKYLAVVRSKPEYEKIKSRTEKVLGRIPFVGRHITKLIYRIKTNLKNFIYKSTMFEDMGFRYMGPIDGHNIERICDALESAKMIDSPVLLHVKTTKGKGYDFAEQQPSEFHGISRFDIN